MDSGLLGIVSVVESSVSEILGEWIVEVDENTIKQKPGWGDKYLPPIQQKLAIEVESLVKIYMAGYRRDTEVHEWLNLKVDDTELTPTQLKQIYLNHAH